MGEIVVFKGKGGRPRPLVLSGEVQFVAQVSHDSRT